MYTSDNNYSRGYSGRQRDAYPDEDRDRYEDDRYHASNYGRREEDDYGPFSNIYDNNPYSRGDWDTRYNEKENYYYDRRPLNDRSDEARGQSLGDLFRGGRRRTSGDRDYFTSSRNVPRHRYAEDDYAERNNVFRPAYGTDNRYNDPDYFEEYEDRLRAEEQDRRWPQYRPEGRSRSYSGYSTGYNRRRRYNEGYLY